MNKIIKTALVCSTFTTSLLVGQNGDSYQRATQITTSGYSLHSVGDVINDGTNFIGLCEVDSSTSKRGFDIVKVDENAGTTLSGKIYLPGTASYSLTGQRILSISGNYYVMANYAQSSSSSGTAFLKISASTGAVVFSEYISARFCSLPQYMPVDMVYDGSAYIYMLGHIFNTSSADLWVAKFDLNGNIQYIKELVNNNFNETAQNIYYQNDSSIYIGGIVDSIGVVANRGLMVQIDNNANIKACKKITYSYTGNPRVSTFNLIRNSSNLYAVANTYIGVDGIGPFLVEKLDLNMNDVAHSFYNYTNYSVSNLWFLGGQSKIFINNGHIVVPAVDRDGNSLVSRRYLNAFFDLNTNFLNANVLNKSLPAQTNGDYGIYTYPYPTSSDGYIFSFAGNTNVSNGVYYMKGTKDFDYTNKDAAPCDTTYPLITTAASLIISSHSLTSIGENNGVCAMSAIVNTPSYTTTTNCYFCVACQREVGIKENTPASFGESIEVSPNPSSGKFNVKMNLPSATNITCVVMNSLGQVVYQRNEYAEANMVISHDLSALSKGSYFMHISDEAGNRAVKQIIIE
jgi:hypothetical protein